MGAGQSILDIEAPLDLLEQRIIGVLQLNGVSESDARSTADVLVDGSARGYLLHGVERLLQILSGFKHRTLSPSVTATVVRETSALAVIDAHYGLGPPLGKKGMELAIQKAKEVGVVGVINGSHLGALAYYSELASAHGCVGLSMSTSSPAVVITGGNKKTFGTNPISYSIPNVPFPITADFATSRVSRGKIYDYQQKGIPIPSKIQVIRPYF